MNIDDIERTNSVEGDRLKNIFDRQLELMEKYHHIEKSNGLLLDGNIPVAIDSQFGQQRLKDFAWRITEEIGESLEAFYNDDKHHAREEAADALHFMVELILLSGLDYITAIEKHDFDDYKKDSKRNTDRLEFLFDYYSEPPHQLVSVESAVADLVLHLGMTMNCLKNKPWKQSQMQTDLNKYWKELRRSMQCLVTYARRIGHDADSFFDFYFRKSEVNKFRQRSNY